MRYYISVSWTYKQCTFQSPGLLALPRVILLCFASVTIIIMARTRTLSLKNIKVVSFDVTGTLLIHKFPIVETYSDAAKWAQLQNPPKAAELKEPFKQAYKTMSKQYPSFRIDDDLYSSRRWWAQTLKMTLELSGRHYNNADFDRYFRYGYVCSYIHMLKHTYAHSNMHTYMQKSLPALRIVVRVRSATGCITLSRFFTIS